MNISENKNDFIDNIMEFKDEMIKNLNNSIVQKDIEELRSGFEDKYNKEKFKEYFIKKTAIHITFKYIFIRMMSESQRLVNSKFNTEGIVNWNEMSKNYRKNYLMLFNISCEDLRRIEQTNEFFEPCIYDKYLYKMEYTIFNKENNNIIEKLKDYDFKTLDPNTAASLFDRLYSNEDRSNLQGFLDESKITTYLVKSLGMI